jgi:hypothetical protein
MTYRTTPARIRQEHDAEMARLEAEAATRVLAKRRALTKEN